MASLDCPAVPCPPCDGDLTEGEAELQVGSHTNTTLHMRLISNSQVSLEKSGLTQSNTKNKRSLFLFWWTGRAGDGSSSVANDSFRPVLVEKCLLSPQESDLFSYSQDKCFHNRRHSLNFDWMEHHTILCPGIKVPASRAHQGLCSGTAHTALTLQRAKMRHSRRSCLFEEG